MVLKVDAKFKKITSTLLKELDAVARNGIKDELASLDPLLRNVAGPEDVREQYDFEGLTLLAADIPDPTDFPTNELRQLDASLRCTICSEFYDAPVTLSCGHCFCSLCIREHVSREAQCPSCRKPTAETQLRLNPALEEVVAAWKTSRPTVLRLSREEQRYINSERTPRRSRSPNANSAKRKRNTRSESTDSGIVCVAGPSNSSPVSSGDRRSSKRRDMEPSSDIGEEELEPTSLVSCPVCRRSVEFQLINSHMDGPDCVLQTTYRDDFKRLVEEARRTGVAKPTGPSLCTVQQEDHVDVTIVHDSEEEQLL
ncbi:hypothetical protein ID866_10934 [Astraeus odoratus]|nr:hypothetical protein ID866_10934 [Astraeus odoratus]